MSLQNKTILITGGAGYVGSHVAKHFLEKGAEVIVVDDLSRGFREAVEVIEKFGKLEFLEGDIADAKFVDSAFSKRKIDAVVHCAALCLPHESFERTFDYYNVNLLGTVNILEAMKKNKVKHLTFASTCAVYADADDKPIDVNHPVAPHNPYAESKLLAEEAIKLASQLHDIKYVIFRFFNICGADEEGLIGDGRKPPHLLMQNAVRGALELEDFYYTCQKVDTPDGTPIRDYVNVLDLARAHELAVSYLLDDGQNETVNLGSGKGCSVKEIVANVEQVLGVSLEKKQAKPRPGEPSTLYANTTSAEKILGWKPEKSLTDSINSLAIWYRKHPNCYKY